jgi:hypothetical protein
MNHDSIMQIPVPFVFDPNVRVRDQRVDTASAVELGSTSAPPERPWAVRLP